MKLKLVLLQLSCLVFYTSGIKLIDEYNVHFVWSNEIGLENAVKTIEFFDGSMSITDRSAIKYKYLIKNLKEKDKNSRDEFKALWIHNTTNTRIPKFLEEYYENIFDVRVENTDLAKIDESITSGLAKIERFYLGRNKINEITPDAFKKLTKLTVLCLNNNLISSLNDRILEQVIHLRKINLSFNLLTEISSTLFSHNRKLQEIYLDGNKLHTIADNAFKNTNLKAITLGDNDCINTSTFPAGRTIPEVLNEIRENCTNTV